MDRKAIIKFSQIVWPYFFLVLVWFTFSYAFFLKGAVPFPSKYQVTHFHPWSIYNIYNGPVKNDALPDVVGEIYPWRSFSISELKKGQLPVWNPNNFSGNPHIANYQSATFSIFNVLFLFSPFLLGWSIIVLLQPLLAGIFTFILLREFAVSKTGALISGITFMFCGFMVVWMAYGTLGMAIAFLPLALFVIEKFFTSRKLLWLVLLSLTIIFSFFSGHFQTSFYLLICICAFVLYKVWLTKKVWDGCKIIVFIGIGLLIASVQIIPTIFFYQQSARSGDFLTIAQNESGIPFYYIVTLFIPDFFGNPVTRNNWDGRYIEWASFIGIVPLLLLSFTIFLRKKSVILFFAILAVVSLFLAIRTPLQEILFSLHIPVLSTSYPTRIIVLFSFSCAVLAGFGFDVLRNLLELGKKKQICYILLSFSLLFFAIWSVVLFSKLLSPEQISVTLRNLFIPTGIFIGMCGVIMLAFFFKKKRFLAYILLGLLFLVSFDSFRFAQKWVAFDPKEYVYTDVTILKKMQQLRGEGRVYGHLGNEVYTYYNLPAIEGYDPLFLKRYAEFIASSEKGLLEKTNRYEVLLPRQGKYTDKVLDLLGVTLIYHPISDTNQNWAYPVWEKKDRNKLVFQDERVQLYRNTQALPHAVLFYDYNIIKNDDEIIKRFYNNSFDFRKRIILEEDPQLKKEKNGSGKTDIVEYLPNKISISVNTTRPALLFISDNYYPNWEATVNGKKEKIYRADYTFRAVKVPKGKSTVIFKYKYF